MAFRLMFHEGKHAKHAEPPTFDNDFNNDKTSNNDIKTSFYNDSSPHDSIEDGTDLGKSIGDFPGPQHYHTEEDANHNGRIDGDNGDGIFLNYNFIL